MAFPLLALVGRAAAAAVGTAARGAGAAATRTAAGAGAAAFRTGSRIAAGSGSVRPGAAAPGQNRAERVTSFLANAGFAYDTVKRFFQESHPSYSEAIEVVVYGGPTANKSQLKNLALSIAFGRAYPPNLHGAAQVHDLKIDTDEVLRVVKVSYAWQMGGWAATNESGPDTESAGLARMVIDRVDTCVGGDWPWPYYWTAVNIRNKKNLDDTSVPALERVQHRNPANVQVLLDSDRVLITDRPAPNPFPAFDAKSRSTDLTIAFAAALEDPGTPPPPPDWLVYGVAAAPQSTFLPQQVPEPNFQDDKVNPGFAVNPLFLVSNYNNPPLLPGQLGDPSAGPLMVADFVPGSLADNSAAVLGN